MRCSTNIDLLGTSQKLMVQVRVVNIPAKEENNSLTIADLVPGQNYEFKVQFNNIMHLISIIIIVLCDLNIVAGQD